MTDEKEETPARYKAVGNYGWGYGETIAAAVLCELRNNPSEKLADIRVMEIEHIDDQYGKRHAYPESMRVSELDVREDVHEKLYHAQLLIRSMGKKSIEKAIEKCFDRVDRVESLAD